jgi:hypothetical protein
MRQSSPVISFASSFGAIAPALRGGAIASTLVALIGAFALGCGDDDEGGTSAACAGDGCSCKSQGACTCDNGQDCKATCVGTCSLTCLQAAECSVKGNVAVTVDCNDDSDCKVEAGNGNQLGDGSSILCSERAQCNFKTGAAAVATCEDDSICKLNLGRRSAVSCKDRADCDIKCEDGDCEVECGPDVARCAVDCGAPDAGTPAVECEDGRLLCGEDC